MLATIRAEMTPGRVARSSSARWMGRTLPAMSDCSAIGPGLFAGNGTEAPARRGNLSGRLTTPGDLRHSRAVRQGEVGQYVRHHAPSQSRGTFRREVPKILPVN